MDFQFDDEIDENDPAMKAFGMDSDDELKAFGDDSDESDEEDMEWVRRFFFKSYGNNKN